MQLLDLPAELLRTILVYAVTVRGIKRGLRLRLVNRLCSEEVIKALYESDLLDDFVARGLERDNHGYWLDRFWTSYLVHKAMLDRFPPKPAYAFERIKFFRRVAEDLCKQTGDVDQTKLREYVHAMCNRPDILRRLQQSYQPTESEYPRHLLQAAIINQCLSVVRNILQSTDAPSDILHFKYKQDVVGSSLWLAGRSGDVEILEVLLSTRLSAKARLSDMDEMRVEAMRGAIFGGHLHAVEFVLDARWGPWHSISSTSLIESPLPSGMTYSPHVDFHAQIYNLLMSRHPNGYPVELDEFDRNELLHNVLASGRQFVDLVTHLLDTGAELQVQHDYPSNRTHLAYPRYPPVADPPRPWNPLRRAVIWGQEQVVRLLLDRGAKPNFTDDDVLWHAVKRGRMDIVRMIVDAGAHVNMVPDPPPGSQTTTPEPPVVHAIMLEHEEMCRFLLEHGAVLDTESGGEALRRATAVGLESMVWFLRDHEKTVPRLKPGRPSKSRRGFVEPRSSPA